MVALAGLLFTGLAVFTSMALATIVVVAIAVIGSVTVLPATLALLGDRIDKGRIPFLGRRRPRADGGRVGPARAHGHRAARRRARHAPSACSARSRSRRSTCSPRAPSRRRSRATCRSSSRSARSSAPSPAPRATPSSSSPARGLDARGRQAGLHGPRRAGPRGDRRARVGRRSRSRATAAPRSSRSRCPTAASTAAEDTVAALRDRVTPTASQVAPGARALLTGDAAGSADFTHRLATATPLVIGARARPRVPAARRRVPLAAPRRGGDRAQPAVGRRRLRRARRGLPARAGPRACSASRARARSPTGCRCSRS